MEAIATSISSPLLPRIQQNLAFSSSWKAPIGGLLQRHGQSVVVRRRKRRSGASQSRRPSFSFSIPLQCSSLPTEEESFKFCDEGSEVEIRIQLPSSIVEEPQMSAENVIVDAQDTSLAVVLRKSMSLKVLIEVPRLYGRIKPSETIWLVDEDEIVIILKKADQDLAWPGLSETWGPLTKGVPKLLKGTSVYIVGDSTDINWAVARELAAGLEYVPLQTCSLLEDLTKKSLKELLEDGEDDVADAEALILSSLNTHVRVVVSTLGGRHGAATRFEKWSKLYAGFTIWLSQSEAKDEESASEEALREKTNMKKAYAKADVVVALGGWDGNARPAAEGCLKALKYLIESEKDLPGKKSLYIRLGCRGDWPNIMPPGWNPSSTNAENSKAFPM